MKKILFLLVFLINRVTGFGQTFQTSGNWLTTSNWVPAAVPPSDATIDVTVSANPTISSTQIIGAITDGNVIDYTITSTGSLTVGSPTLHKNMTFGNNGNIGIASGGVLEIWGDLIVHNNLTLDDVGTLIVHGNITMNNGSTIHVGAPGSVTVYGDLTGHTNTTLIVGGGGSLHVGGALGLGVGSTISSSGGNITAGSCTCTGCSAACNVVLPVTLISFKAVAVDDAVHVKWSTSAEINFHYFILEKSSDGVRFFDVANILGSGRSSSRKDYFFEDVHPFTDLSYYRITAVDYDGYRETFHKNVASVKMDSEKKFKVFPNPVSDGQVTAKLNFDSSPTTEVHIYNCLGVWLARYQMTSPETVISLPALENGVYFAKLVSGQFSQVTRFVVLKN